MVSIIVIAGACNDGDAIEKKTIKSKIRRKQRAKERKHGVREKNMYNSAMTGAGVPNDK